VGSSGGRSLHVDEISPVDFGADPTGAAYSDTAIANAIAALPGGKGTLRFPVGTFKTATAILLGTGMRAVGAGRGATIIDCDTDGFNTNDPGVRTYYQQIRGLSLVGPGSGEAGSIGIELDSITYAKIDDVSVSGFAIGAFVHSAVSGGTVYNTFTDTTFLSCATGVDINTTSSNSNRWFDCRFGACTTGWKVTDANNNECFGCCFEGNTTGVYVTAASAGLSDANAVIGCRFEANDTAWDVAHANVRDFVMLSPGVFGTYTFSDSGTRTMHVATYGYGTWKVPGYVDFTGTKIGFYGTAAASKPAVSGAKGSNAALGSLMTALAGLGLVTDSTSA
jgi:hypothetical protein